MPSFWVWDLYPLSLRRSENRRVNDEIPKGFTLSIQTGSEPVVSNMFTGRVYSTRLIYRHFYRPTDRDLELLSSRFPDEDPENPSWDSVEAELVAGGYASSRLRSEKAPTLVRLLKDVKTADVARTQETKPTRNPLATQSQGGTESKDHVVDATKPDATGYVARPSDLSSYVPMATIRADHCEDVVLTTIKEILKVLKDFPTNRVRWTRPPSKKTGTPHPQRRSIHLVDWKEYVNRLKH